MKSIFLMSPLAIGLVSSLPCAASAGEVGGEVGAKVEVFPDSNFSNIKAEIDGGSLTIGVTPKDSSVKYAVRSLSTPENSLISATLEAGTLKLISKKSGSHASPECTVDWEILVPNDRPISVKMGGGQVRVMDYAGDLDLSIGGGRLDTGSVLRSLKLKAGSIEGDLKGPAEGDFRYATGRLNITWESISPLPSVLKYKTSVGELYIRAPEGATVNMDEVKVPPSARFHKESELPSSEAANIIITGSAVSGCIDVKKL